MLSPPTIDAPHREHPIRLGDSVNGCVGQIASRFLIKSAFDIRGLGRRLGITQYGYLRQHHTPATRSALTSLLIRPSLNIPSSRLCCAVLAALSSRPTPAGISHACSGFRLARSRARWLMAPSPAGNSSAAPGSCRSTSRSIFVKPPLPPRNSLAHLRPGIATERITSLACGYTLRFSDGFHHHS